MMNALKIAATGMSAQQMNVDVLSNNISNLNTTAFKRQVASFHDLMYQTYQAPGAATSDTDTKAPTGTQIGMGVNIGSVYKINTQGAVNRTDNPFDLAIQGRGFFKITTPDGTSAYTRDGSFSLNENGDMVTSQGYMLDPAINVPSNATEVTISDSGAVSAKINGAITSLGQLTISMFANEAGLENMGNNLMKESIASGTPSDVLPKTASAGSGSLLQNFLEGSNVDPVESVTSLISAQRAYELNSRVIATSDEMLNAVNQIR